MSQDCIKHRLRWTRPATAETEPILQVKALAVEYHTRTTVVRALDGVDLSLRPGDRLGLVGESGSGKTTLGLALPRLLPANATIPQGRIIFQGQELLKASEKHLRATRGADIAMVFQDAATSFDPVRTIGSQIVEAIKAHQDVPRPAAKVQAAELLHEVDVPRPRERLRQYPHELSGGQRQRAMIAMALAASPQVLIADEPTSALDVTTQAGVIELLTRLSEERRMATILITHDLSVVARFATEVMVLYSGRVMETAPSEAALLAPLHPHTADLVASVPRLGGERLRRLNFIAGSAPHSVSGVVGCIYQPRCPIGDVLPECRTQSPPLRPRHDMGTPTPSLVACHRSGEYKPPALVRTDAQETGSGALDPVLTVDAVSKTYRLGRSSGHRLRALSSVSLEVGRGESFGVVGESGSGKTSLARIIVGLIAADSGTVTYRPVVPKGRSGTQMVFQDPADSLNPMMSVQQVVTEPIAIQRGRSRTKYREEAETLLDSVGLPPEFLTRRPSQLSGGQRQRVAIARALSTEPELIVCDEAVSALDMSARGQILNLLADLGEQRGLAYLYISHDLSLVRHVCDRVAVMHAGEIVEIAPVEDLFRFPQHPYTQLLLDSVPSPDPVFERTRRRPFPGVDGPDGTGIDVGCPFRWRCPRAQEVCAKIDPPLEDVRPDHAAACHFPGPLEEGAVPGLTAAPDMSSHLGSRLTETSLSVEGVRWPGDDSGGG
jgi:peptide/nickel transport system ATP-binding protein